MTEQSRYWASGNWRVADGKADEFVERWAEFLTWSKEANDGFLSARLIRDRQDPNHFVSFAAWRDPESMDAWKAQPGFAERFSSCRELCADMQGGNYELACAV
ncbi:antibiotic biosynthesis monooxygenase family protein [Rhodococcus daqingensis]|uniref:Antibiotic biosynthesis monooxygenase family protein n=1 Tax=Rhodococcus daqingensis TaxID=2479363 RepID=A0ABW2RRK2_9NOCA